MPTRKTVIHCWSAPRSRSTALCYSFEAHPDCTAIDEPLYREWLIQEKGDRPYRQAMIDGAAPEGSKSSDSVWKRELASLDERIAEAKTSIVFCKHMAKHAFLYDFDKENKHGSEDVIHKHLLLIRDPVAVLSSWKVSNDVHNASVTPDEVGIVPLLSIYSSLASTRSPFVVLDSDELVKDPKNVLQHVYEQLDIPYSPEVMSWKSGKHDCDGPWADWWYDNVHKSTGWNSETTEKYRTLDPALLPALRASYPAYKFLYTLTRNYKQRGPTETIYEDPRNEHLLAYVGVRNGSGCLVPREFAGVNPWDSSVQGGDATWEGLRVYRGKILSLDKHLRRLYKSAKALGFENMHTREEIIDAIFKTLAANNMRDGAHMRLTLTRGEKCTSSMNPKFNVYGTTLIILAEWKPVQGATTYDNKRGITLITASQRRNSPQTCDSKIHHNNMINNILPKMQANLAGAADAIMLDLDGYVSETNATNIFMVDDGVLLTPHADHCLPGITRATVLELVKELDIPTEVRRISLSEFHAADEVFTTGTMGELSPVRMIDGRLIGQDGSVGPVTLKLQEIYQTLPERPGWATEIPPYD